MTIFEAVVVALLVLILYYLYCNHSSPTPPPPPQTPTSAPTAPVRQDPDILYGHCITECHYTEQPDTYVGAIPYSEWITSQSIEPDAIASHNSFTEERVSGKSKNILGRTLALGEIEGTDQTPWIGIRGRPQHVPTNNPIQVADVDPNAFVEKRKFVWNS